MRNQLIRFRGEKFKCLVITDDELWLGEEKVKSIEKFEEYLNGKQLIKLFHKYPLKAFQQIDINRLSEGITIKYKDHRNEDKKLNIDFGDQNLSNQVGHFLGVNLEMDKTQQTESKWKPLLKNVLWLLFILIFTYYLSTVEDTNTLLESGTGKRKIFPLIVKLLIDNLGMIGIYVISGLSSSYLLFRIYKRFTKPSTVFTYSKRIL